MRYLHAYLAIAICVVQAKAALQIVPGLPFPVAAQGMRWIGSVTPGGRNVTLYGTLDVSIQWFLLALKERKDLTPYIGSRRSD